MIQFLLDHNLCTVLLGFNQRNALLINLKFLVDFLIFFAFQLHKVRFLSIFLQLWSL